MSIFEGFFAGIGVYGKAFQILFTRKFFGFLFFPALALVLLFWGGSWLVSFAGDGLAEIVQAKIAEWVEGISWLQWLNSTLGFLVRIVLKITYFFLFITFGGYIVLIIMSPVYSWLSERTEVYLSGKEYPFSLRQLIWEIFRGILIAFRNMIFQLLFTVFLFFCSFIPVIGLLSPVALFLVSAYFYGFSFVDYAIERKRFNVKQSVRYVNKNVGVVTGVGVIFAFSLMVPWFSIIACSFVSILSVIAGTVAVHQVTQKETEKIELKK
ncbi:EI24 domain-containing protein [Odoribacter laneus]|uniref:EI24 domain-containing protein n=1 Tax=Odoribacter laneus TaxID=626933 RepID=UPI003AB43EC2